MVMKRSEKQILSMEIRPLYFIIAYYTMDKLLLRSPWLHSNCMIPTFIAFASAKVGLPIISFIRCFDHL